MAMMKLEIYPSIDLGWLHPLDETAMFEWLENNQPYKTSNYMTTIDIGDRTPRSIGYIEIDESLVEIALLKFPFLKPI